MNTDLSIRDRPHLHLRDHDHDQDHLLDHDHNQLRNHLLDHDRDHDRDHDHDHDRAALGPMCTHIDTHTIVHTLMLIEEVLVHDHIGVVTPLTMPYLGAAPTLTADVKSLSITQT